MLNLTEADRVRLKINTIGTIDVTPDRAEAEAEAARPSMAACQTSNPRRYPTGTEQKPPQTLGSDRRKPRNVLSPPQGRRQWPIAA